MIGCGILVAGLAGLCTLIFAGVTLGGAGSMGFGEFASSFMLVAMVAGVPLVIGIGLVVGGRAILRSAREAEARHESDAPGESGRPPPASLK
jgi:hypothetical protein